jgi:hypothetical protein
LIRAAKIACVVVSLLSFASAKVTITTPLPGSSTPSSVRFVISASSDYGNPTSSIILYVDGAIKKTVYASKLDTYLTLPSGWRQILIKSWDSKGNIAQAGPYGINVGASSGGGSSDPATTVFYNVEQMSGWGHCDECAGAGGTGPSAPYSMTQNQASPSLDGNSTKFWLGGSTPYSNALWWKQLVSESQAAKNRSLRHFVYDAYFYIENPSAAQSLEWDVNQFIDGESFIMGTQCSYRAAGTWDIWDNIGERWVSTGIACPALQAYKWHHVVVEFERTWDNKLRYVSLSMNGVKHYINRYYSPRSTSWSGITVNYQMDGNVRQDDYSTWVDKLTLKAW